MTPTARGTPPARRRPPPTRPRPDRAGRPGRPAPAPWRRRGRCGCPPSTSTSSRSPTASTTGPSARTVDGVSSSWRPPWFDTTMPSIAAVGRLPGVVGIEDALQHQLPGQCRRTQSRSSQVTDGSNWASTQAWKSVGLTAPGHGLLQVAERVGPSPEPDVPRPGRVQPEVEPPEHGAAQRRCPGHAVAGVPVARADGGEVDGEHQDRAADGGGTGHQVLGVGAVPHDVELEPDRVGHGGGDLLDAADRRRSTRRTRHRPTRPPVPPGPLPGWRTSRPDRPARAPPASASSWPSTVVGQVELGHVAQHPLAELYGGQVVHVGGQRGLGEGAAVDVVEQLSGQAAPGQLPVVAHRAGGHTQGPVGEESAHRTDASQSAAPRPGARTRVTNGPRPGHRPRGMVEAPEQEEDPWTRRRPTPDGTGRRSRGGRDRRRRGGGLRSAPDGRSAGSRCPRCVSSATTSTSVRSWSCSRRPGPATWRAPTAGPRPSRPAIPASCPPPR